MSNKYSGVCHACNCSVPAFAGVLESLPVYSRGRMKSKYVVWCKVCYNKSDNSGDEDRACGDRAYEDACERACNY